MIIFHCVLQATWDKEIKEGSFGQSAIETSGFIKCIKPEKVTSDNFTYPSTFNHTILCINTDSLDADSFKFEDDYIYISKPIAPSAVVATIPYTFDNKDKFSKSKELSDIEVINDVLKNLDISFFSLKYFRDGTDSRIFLLNGQYIIKQNDTKLLKSEYEFSKVYSDNNKIQKVVFLPENSEYIVYEYVPGDVMHIIDDFDDLMKNIKSITDSYKESDSKSFGYVHNPSESWIEFLKARVHDASLNLPDSFDFLPLVYESLQKLETYAFKKKLIHGDLGTHNFIKKNNKFVAAIDPIPTVGDPLYDYLYACLSNIDIVKRLSLNMLEDLTKENHEKLKALLIVILFCRISTCLNHHKEDFDSYVDFWYKIIEE